MSVQSITTTLRTLDGLHLAGTLVNPDDTPERAVILVYGGGVTREEGGFFTRLAARLGEAGVASFRFDLRGHGELVDIAVEPATKLGPLLLPGIQNEHQGGAEDEHEQGAVRAHGDVDMLILPATAGRAGDQLRTH